MSDYMKEKALSVALGLSRDILKELRSSYTEGVDWNKIPSKKPENLWEVQWTEEGINNLKANLGFKEQEKIVPQKRSVALYTISTRIRKLLAFWLTAKTTMSSAETHLSSISVCMLMSAGMVTAGALSVTLDLTANINFSYEKRKKESSRKVWI